MQHERRIPRENINERPAERHLDMIDRIDHGETITNTAMLLQLSQVFRNDRRRSIEPSSLLNSVVGFLNLVPPQGAHSNNACVDIYNLSARFAEETLEQALRQNRE